MRTIPWRLWQATEESTKFLVTVSYLEIYNEVLHDLLNPTQTTLRIREHPELGILLAARPTARFPILGIWCVDCCDARVLLCWQ